MQAPLLLHRRCCIACRCTREASMRDHTAVSPRKTRTVDIPYFPLFPVPLNPRFFHGIRRSWPRLSRNTIHGARDANISSFAYRARRGHLHSSVPVLPASILPLLSLRIRTSGHPSLLPIPYPSFVDFFFLQPSSSYFFFIFLPELSTSSDWRRLQPRNVPRVLRDFRKKRN